MDRFVERVIIKPPREVEVADTFAPTTLDSTSIHQSTIGSIIEWIRNSSKVSPILVIRGPSGCGKTIAVRIAIHETNSVPIEHVMGKSRPKMITDELDTVYTIRPRNTVLILDNMDLSRNDIVPYLKKTRVTVPTIVITQGTFNTTGEIGKTATFITMDHPTNRELMALARTMSPKITMSHVKQAKGDMRFLINQIHFGSLNCERFVNFTIFEATNMLLESTPDLKESIDLVEICTNTVTCMMFENYHTVGRDIHTMAHAADMFSCSDIFQRNHLAEESQVATVASSRYLSKERWSGKKQTKYPSIFAKLSLIYNHEEKARDLNLYFRPFSGCFLDLVSLVEVAATFMSHSAEHQAEILHQLKLDPSKLDMFNRVRYLHRETLKNKTRIAVKQAFQQLTDD